MSAIVPVAATPDTLHATQIADYVRGLAIDLERLSQEAGLDTVAACLRATITEARRVKSDDNMIKLGLKLDRRAG